MHEINPNQSPVYLNAGLFYFILIFNQVKHSFLIFQLIVAMSIMFSSCSSRKLPEEIQLTNDLSYNHDLDNNDNFHQMINGWCTTQEPWKEVLEPVQKLKG